MNQKYLDPKFLTMIATVVVTFLNHWLGIDIDIEKAAGALIVVSNYLIMQFIVDIKKVKNGEPTSGFNSLKLVTTAIICISLGISNYYGMEMSEQEIMTFVGLAMIVINGKGLKDIVQPKGELKDDNQSSISIESHK